MRSPFLTNFNNRTQCQDYNDQHQTFKLVNGVNLTSPFLKTIKTVDGTPNGSICGALCLKESHFGRCCNGFQVNTEYQCTLYHNVYHKTSEGPDNIYSTNLCDISQQQVQADMVIKIINI